MRSIRVVGNSTKPLSCEAENEVEKNCKKDESYRKSSSHAENIRVEMRSDFFANFYPDITTTVRW